MYFKDFPIIVYKFGKEVDYSAFHNLSAYTDIIDAVSDNFAFYQPYTIFDKRPDQVSYELYGTANFHWTFYYMNNNIRRGGWPIGQNKIEDWIKDRYNGTVIVTRDSLDNVMKVGDTVTGVSSTVTGTITRRNEDLGQIFIEGTKAFTNSELIRDGDGNTVTVFSSSEEYNATHNYTDGDGVHADIDPANGPGELLTNVTFYDYIIDENDKQRTIKVIKPEAISGVVSAFREALRSN